ncbi:sensor domain-containing diguanylate cyclase [Antrihabitans stalactiti]|nr:GGDEF domain-containing protein [Antrihabitans stalactiti]
MSTLSSVVRSVRLWWAIPVDYWWLVGYLESHLLARMARAVVATFSILFGATAILLVISQSGPHGVPGNVLGGVTAGVSLLWAARWSFGSWPQLWLSQLTVVLADGCISLLCVQTDDAVVGLLALVGFVLTTAYTVIFHGPKLLLLHMFWVLASATIAFGRMWSTGAFGGDAGAIGVAVLGGFAFVVTPPVVQLGFWMMRTDAVESGMDPLTGVLNRRGLFMHVDAMESRADADPEAVIVVVAIDLDLFKQVNDTFGHSVGDEVLLRTARRIQTAARETAVLARVGGEEFVLLDVMSKVDIAPMAERVRHAIGEPAERAHVTASCGAACVAVADWTTIRRRDRTAVLETVLMRADRAMYDAKRGGRDRIVVDAVPVETASIE